MRVTLLTCAAQPGLSADDQLLGEAIARRGVDVRACPWSTLEVGDAGAAAVLRSTWDYHLAFARFMAWLDETERHAMPLVNPQSLVRWNADKRYLRDLAADGVAVPDTIWLEAPTRDGVADAFATTGWDRAVLKPCVSASAHQTTVVAPGRLPGEEAIAPLRAHGALLQQFVPEIQVVGELSVVFFGGAYSHAVVKRPCAGDFRVQPEYGGTEASVCPAAVERRFAKRALAALPEPPAYARVDIVTTARGPLLIEMELIEPVLFLGFDAEAPDRFAGAILDRT